jgi:hypothetical protein
MALDGSQRRCTSAHSRFHARSVLGKCSTPEGIETKSSRAAGIRRRGLLTVLNARRYRDEDQQTNAVGIGTASECSTPEGIETKSSVAVSNTGDS